MPPNLCTPPCTKQGYIKTETEPPIFYLPKMPNDATNAHAIAGAIVVAMGYSYAFGKLGGN